MNRRTTCSIDRSAADATIAALAELFPQTFARDRWQPHRALKIGVDRDLVASGALTAQEVSSVLSLYTRRYQYLVVIARGGPRFDLAGEPCGEVSPEHQAGARIAVERYEALAAEKLREAIAHRHAARVEQFRAARAEYHARRARLKAAPDPVSPTQVAVPESPALKRRLGLSDLRRLGAERRAASSRGEATSASPT